MLFNDEFDPPIVIAQVRIESAAREHGRLCVAAAFEMMRQDWPNAATAELDLTDWTTKGVEVRVIRDGHGEKLFVEPIPGAQRGGLFLNVARGYLYRALRFADPRLLGWESFDNLSDVPVRWLMKYSSAQEAATPSPEQDASAAESRTRELISHTQAEEWAGRPLTAEDMERLGAAIPNSSIPDAIGAIVRSFGVEPYEAADDQDLFRFWPEDGSYGSIVALPQLTPSAAVDDADRDSIQRAMEWLYDTEQPGGASIPPNGVEVPTTSTE